MTSPEVAQLLRTDPRLIGEFRILGRLGTGGMATVYLGTSSADGADLVAIKLIHPHLAADPEFRGRFEREVELAAKAPSHCTAGVLGQGVYEEQPYLVTEYLAGTPLHKLVESEGPLPPSSLHDLALGLAAGLAAIHGCDLVHRDVKPSNVMVMRGGVRIIDFGIARTLDTTTEFTRSGIVMGSLGWTSPEQLDGHGPVPAMDIFAWGCVVAYAATGRHPFGGEDAAARTMRILQGQPTLDGLPPVLEELVRAALRRAGSRRPTARELLLGLVGGADEVVRVPGPARSAGLRRRRTAVLAGIPAGLVLALVLSSAAGGPFQIGRTPADAGRPASVTDSPGTDPPGTDPPTPGATGEPEAGGTPTVVPTPGTSTVIDEPDEWDDPGGSEDDDGNGHGNGKKKSKKPWKSKRPRR